MANKRFGCDFCLNHTTLLVRKKFVENTITRIPMKVIFFKINTTYHQAGAIECDIGALKGPFWLPIS